jgi:hypothetical protein
MRWSSNHGVPHVSRSDSHCRAPAPFALVHTDVVWWPRARSTVVRNKQVGGHYGQDLGRTAPTAQTSNDSRIRAAGKFGGKNISIKIFFLVSNMLDVSSKPLPGNPDFFSSIINKLQRSNKKNQTLRSVLLWVGRSVREPTQDGSEYKAIRLIAMRSVVRCAESASLIHAFTRWEVLSPAAFGRNDGIRGSQGMPLVHELLAQKLLARVDRRRSAHKRPFMGQNGAIADVRECVAGVSTTVR